MSENNASQFVIEIDPTKKYILHVNRSFSVQTMEDIRNRISTWIKSDEPILVVFGDGETLKLVKVE